MSERRSAPTRRRPASRRCSTRVAHGEQITITKHGRPVARLVPRSQPDDVERRREAIERLKKFRQGANAWAFR